MDVLQAVWTVCGWPLPSEQQDVEGKQLQETKIFYPRALREQAARTLCDALDKIITKAGDKTQSLHQDQATKEDLRNDVLLKLLRQRTPLPVNTESALLAYLNKMVQHAYIDLYIRPLQKVNTFTDEGKKKVEKVVFVSIVGGAVSGDDWTDHGKQEYMELQDPDAHSPEEQITLEQRKQEEHQKLQQVWGMFDRLVQDVATRKRESFRKDFLQDIEQMTGLAHETTTFVDLHQQTGQTMTTLYKRHSRARKELHEHLSDFLDKQDLGQQRSGYERGLLGILELFRRHKKPETDE